MNKKTLIISVGLIVLLAALILVYFFVIKPSSNNEIPQAGVMENDLFSIKLPEGWVEVEPVYQSYVTAIKSNEQINNAGAKELGFNSYYSVVGDTYAKDNEKDYVEDVKNSLKTNFKDIVISNEETRTIEGGNIYFVEAKLNQQNVNFRVLLAIKVTGEKVWIISFNTLEEKWSEYKDLFYDVAESLKIK